MEQRLTSAERHLRAWTRALAALFVAVGFAFLLLTETVFAISNRLSSWLIPGLPPIPMSSEKFWLVLTFALLITLATLSYLVQRDVTNNKGYVVPILISKVVSAACYLVMFVAIEHYFIHLSAFISDLLLFVVTLILYRRVSAEKEETR